MPWFLRRRWLALLAFVAFAAAIFLAEPFLLELVASFDRTAAEAMLWVGGPVLAAVVGAYGYRRMTGRSISGQRRWRWSDLGWGLLAGLFVVGLDFLLFTLFDVIVTSEPGEPVQAYIDDALLVMPILVGVGLSIATPFGEEIVFRGILLRGLAFRLPTAIAVALSSLAFGLVHLEHTDPVGLLQIVSATLAGAVFAVAMLKAGHLAAAITAHAVVNGTYTLIGLAGATGLLFTVGPDGDIPRIDLEIGACAQAAWWAGEPIDADTEVACDAPHDVEVAAREPLRVDDTYERVLTEDAVTEAALEQCFAAFERYVGWEWERSILDVVPVLPSPANWDAGDRELICLVVPWMDEELPFPAEGSRR